MGGQEDNKVSQQFYLRLYVSLKAIFVLSQNTKEHCMKRQKGKNTWNSNRKSFKTQKFESRFSRKQHYFIVTTRKDVKKRFISRKKKNNNNHPPLEWKHQLTSLTISEVKFQILGDKKGPMKGLSWSLENLLSIFASSLSTLFLYLWKYVHVICVTSDDVN